MLNKMVVSIVLAGCWLIFLNREIAACGEYGSVLRGDILLALGPADQVSQAALRRLQQAGRPALEALLAFHAELTHEEDQQHPLAAVRLRRMVSVIDQVGGQRGCTVSKLYWHTDLSRAREVAAREGKPILSLRLLGKLTDEYSCANSRFFRTALYSNKEISKRLRDHFVLHWQSVRPVPRVTIDFGDGRILQRTLTGNSVHYLLHADGRPLDVLPGLYGPQAFSQWLTRMEDLAGAYGASAAEQREQLLEDYHRVRHGQVLATWQADLKSIESRRADPGLTRLPLAVPTALDAAARATGKSDVELSVLVALTDTRASELEQQTDSETWQQIAALHQTQAKLDATSIRVVRSEYPTAMRAGAVALTKRVVEDPILRLVRNFESSMAIDTVRNEYVLHRRIHEWFMAREAAQDVEKLNDRIYAELFLTPRSDPWLGLRAGDTYSALENDGMAARN